MQTFISRDTYRVLSSQTMHIQIYTRIHMHIHLHPFTSMHNRCTCACTDTYGHIHVDTNTSRVQTLWGPFGTCQGNQVTGEPFQMEPLGQVTRTAQGTPSGKPG